MPHELQERIQSLLDRHVANGRERGAQVAVYHEGELIVDAWAGIADVRTASPVRGDTLFSVFSTTKGIVATLAHLLAERGQIEYDQAIAHYWPEFAANGKEGITLRHALVHTAGLRNMPQNIDHAQLCDWDYMCRAMAQERPLTAPGEIFSYHGATYGWIIGEVLRRVDGRSVPEILEQEISRPLGSRDIFIGLPAELESRVAFVEEIADPNVPVAPANPNDHPFVPCMEPLGVWMNRSDARRACIPGCNGLMSARGVARHYAALLPGGVDGVELLPPGRVRIATEPQHLPGPPGVKILEKRGLGYKLEHGGVAGFGHGGYGGSVGWANPERKLAIGVARNRFSVEDLVGEVEQEIQNGLGF